jgi:hypothetical protein
MSYGSDLLASQLCEATARTLDETAAERQAATINERDVLHPICLSVARTIGKREAMEVSTTVRLESETWPRLGAVDIGFLVSGEPPLLVELKAGVGRHALVACAWDALKLAFALQIGRASDAYLLAAAPAGDWASARGSEFFSTRAFESEALREDYADGWKTWERDGYPAGSRVPARLATRALSRRRFLVGETPWELRLSAVHVEQPLAWIEWAPLLAPPGVAAGSERDELHETESPVQQRRDASMRRAFRPSIPELIICADWSKHPARRRAWIADPRDRSLRQIASSQATVDTVIVEAAQRRGDGFALIAFDAPIGVPRSYFELARQHLSLPKAATFVDWLPVALRQPDFFEPVTRASDWSVERPFFRVPKGPGGLRSFHEAAQLARIELKRSIEKATRGNSVFAFDLPGQVAPAAQTLWSELAAMVEPGAALWPFDGDFDQLVGRMFVLAEIYPRAAYAVASAEALPARPRSLAKRQPPVREAEVARLLSARWIRELAVKIDNPARAASNEDDFDALMTAAALLRLVLEDRPLSTFAVDRVAEGGILAV